MLKKKITAVCLSLLCAVSLFAVQANAATKNAQAQKAASAKSYEDGWICTHDGVGVNLRKSQSTKSAIVTKIPEGAKVKVLSNVSKTGWYKVSYKGKTGYVKASYVIDKYGDAPGL